MSVINNICSEVDPLDLSSGSCSPRENDANDFPDSKAISDFVQKSLISQKSKSDTEKFSCLMNSAERNRPRGDRGLEEAFSNCKDAMEIQNSSCDHVRAFRISEMIADDYLLLVEGGSLEPNVCALFSKVCMQKADEMYKISLKFISKTNIKFEIAVARIEKKIEKLSRNLSKDSQ